MSYWEKLNEHCANKEHIKFTIRKYRCEQTIITKLNSIPTCTITIKSDYKVERIENTRNPAMNVYCKLLEQFTSVYPNNYEQAFGMLSDLEKIKFESVINVDMQNGQMDDIVNHKEIIQKWCDYKERFLVDYSFVRSAATKESVKQFLESVENVMTDSKLLLAELNSKLFFVVLFGGYLVGREEYLDSYEIDFISQLFKGVRFPMTIKPKIQKESRELVWLERKSEISNKVKKLNDIEQIYDNQFKPTINYSFTEYNATFNTRILINEQEKMLKKAEVYIIEEIQNNMSLLIDCSVRELDDNVNTVKEYE